MVGEAAVEVCGGGCVMWLVEVVVEGCELVVAFLFSVIWRW